MLEYQRSVNKTKLILGTNTHLPYDEIFNLNRAINIKEHLHKTEKIFSEKIVKTKERFLCKKIITVYLHTFYSLLQVLVYIFS
jgi:hypothetical protein